MFENNIEQQVAFYVTHKINHIFNESHIKKGKTENEVSTQFNNFISQIRIAEWYIERTHELKEIIDIKDYARAIKLYNNKGLHSVIEKAFGISSYSQKALDFLKHSDNARSILRNAFPLEI